MGKIVHRFVDIVLFERCLFGCQSFRSAFVRLVGRQPELMAKGEDISVEGHRLQRALSLAKKTVLLVITNPDDDTHVAHMAPHIAATRAESGFGSEFIG